MESIMKEMKDMSAKMLINQRENNDKMDSLKSSLEEIRSQNNKITTQNAEIRTQNEEIQKSMAFLSDKYDEAILEINTLKSECYNNQILIKSLENKVDFLEKNLKAASLEIKNLPCSKPENRDTLIETVQKVGNVINRTVNKNDIKNIFRLKSKTESTGTVIAEFTSPAIKEQFLQSTKHFNKLNKENRLNTNHINNTCPKQPIYVTEVLTAMTKRHYYLAREFIKNSDYQQCWTANGKVYVRKQEGMPSRLIKSEDDLNKLRREK